jgi:hypothetical protein
VLAAAGERRRGLPARKGGPRPRDVPPTRHPALFRPAGLPNSGSLERSEGWSSGRAPANRSGLAM